MKIKPIELADYSNLISFWQNNYFVNEMDEKNRLQLSLEKNPNLSLLIEDKGKIIATILGSFDGRRGYIQKLVVDKNYRRQGLGKKLIREVTKRLLALGALYIPISCKTELIPFYKSCGFTTTNQTTVSLSKSTYPVKKKL